MEASEPSRDAAWHEARSIACVNIARILAKLNVGRPGKLSILERNLAEARELLEESKGSIAQKDISQPKQQPVEKEETPEIDW